MKPAVEQSWGGVAPSQPPPAMEWRNHRHKRTANEGGGAGGRGDERTILSSRVRLGASSIRGGGGSLEERLRGGRQGSVTPADTRLKPSPF